MSMSVFSVMEFKSSTCDGCPSWRKGCHEVWSYQRAFDTLLLSIRTFTSLRVWSTISNSSAGSRGSVDLSVATGPVSCVTSKVRAPPSTILVNSTIYLYTAGKYHSLTDWCNMWGTSRFATLYKRELLIWMNMYIYVGL